MKKLLAILLAVMSVAARAQTPAEQVQVRAAQIYEAIRSRNAELLTPLLADSCRIQGYDGDTGRKVLQAVIAQLPSVDTLRVIGFGATERGVDAEGEMMCGGRLLPCSFSLDGEGRFTAITLVRKVQVAKNRMDALHLAPLCELPFRLRNGFIVLSEGILADGRSGVFILDSGCKTSLFNSASSLGAAAISGEGVSSRSGVVSSGLRSTQLVQVDSLVLGDNLFSLQSAAADLTALAESVGLDELTGLLGAELLRHFETHIDYAKGVVRFYALDAEGSATGAPKPRRRLEFELLKDFLPVFSVRAGDKTLRMVFDTGAQDCCLTPASAGSLGRGFRFGGHAELRDADAAAKVESGHIAALDWGRVKKRKVSAVVRDLAFLGDIDGILGYPMVAGRHISLNYVKCEFCFY